MDIRVYDESFNLLYIIDEYESLIWTERYTECGDFELYIGVDSDILNKLKQDYYLQIQLSTVTMVIEKIEVKTSEEDGDRLIVSGRSLESIIDRRIIWGEKYFDSINVNEFVKTVLTENIISPSNENRKIENFTYIETEDESITGITFSNTYKGDNLYSAIQEITSACQIGMMLTIIDGIYTFSLYKGTDRTRNSDSNNYVLFSPSFDNLTESSYIEDVTNYKNVTLVGGEEPDYVYIHNGKKLSTGSDGKWTVSQKVPKESSTKGHLIENVDIAYNAYEMWEYDKSSKSWKQTGIAYKEQLPRVFGQYPEEKSTKTGLYRRETFTDASNTKSQYDSGKDMSEEEYSKVLNDKGMEDLNQYKVTQVIDGEMDYYGQFQLNRDFDIGDIVEVSNGYGNILKARISEIIISDDVSDGLKTYPSFTNLE